MFKGKGERETKIKVSFTKKTIFKEKREKEKNRGFPPEETIFKGKREKKKKIEV